MKIKGKILSFALTALCLFSSAIPFYANGEENSVDEISYDDKISYRKIDNNSDGIFDLIKISSCVKTATSVSIPDTIEELPVRYIGEDAFSDCTELTQIHLPDTLTSIDTFAFYNCSKLKNIEFPDGLLSIGYAPFAKCVSLKSIKFPEKIEYVGYEAFRDCKSLTSIYIPENLTDIGYQAFSRCTSLTNITVAGNNRRYYTVDDILYERIFLDSGTITQLFVYPIGKKDKSFSIPDNITCICSGAFAGSLNLTSVEIPDSVKEISSFAFYECKRLTSISIPDSVTKFGYNIFQNCAFLKKVKISGGATEVGYQFFMNCPRLKYINIPKNITSIGNEAFNSCKNLTCVNIPASVTSITFNSFVFSDNMKIRGVEGSYAYDYATENNIDFIQAVDGDADCNGKFNIRDAAFIAISCAKNERDYIPEWADFNKDGACNIRDAAAIAIYLAKR